MDYTQGKINRVFVLRFQHQDDLLTELSRFARRVKLKSGLLIFLGALQKGNLVTGPQKVEIPPKPNKVSFRDGWEVLGAGTIFSNGSKPQIHLHSAMGKRRNCLTGCIREKSRVFLVIEAVVFELKGVRASKALDPATGLNLLKIL